MIEGVGISLPGRFDHSVNRLVFAPNLKWPDFDIRNPIVEQTGLDVELENAANACVLAEVWFDRVHACRNLVVITVSEGIGTGILANGALVRGLNGMAGEFGHVPVDPVGSALRVRQPRLLGGVRLQPRGAALLRGIGRGGKRPELSRPVDPRRSGRHQGGQGAGDAWRNTWAAACA